MFIADSQGFMGVNPKYLGHCKGRGDLFLRYGLEKKVIAFAKHPSGVGIKAGSFGPRFFTKLMGQKDMLRGGKRWQSYFQAASINNC